MSTYQAARPPSITTLSFAYDRGALQYEERKRRRRARSTSPEEPALQAPDFDAQVAHAIDAGLASLARETTRVIRNKFLFRGERLVLWFEQDKDSVRFDGPVDRGREAHVLAMVAGWQVT